MSFRKARSALVAAASLALAAAPVIVSAGRDPVAHGATHTASRTTADTTTVAARPSGRAWNVVVYGGVSVRVPASWPVIRLARHPRTCPRVDVHAVYLGSPGPSPACPAGLAGKTATVSLHRVRPDSPDLRQASRATVIGGRPARTTTDAAVTHTIVAIVPSAGMEISLTYGGSGQLARYIEKTIRVTRQAKPARLAAPGALHPAAPQGLVQGPGFDTCAAPSADVLRKWQASRYRSVGIYIGGVNRACAQANLTPAWITSIQGAGWHYFPFYVGLQAPCVAGFGNATIRPGSAGAQGRAAADDAVTQATDLGIPAGTPLIYDMEAYRGGCGATVTTFLSAWDAELHAKGYVAGVYESFSNIGDLVAAAGQMTEPDVIHYADWDNHATTNSSYMPASMWLSHHRIHQYRGGHNETHGGVTLNIDNDQLDVTLSGAALTSVRRPSFRIATAINANGSAEWFARAANSTVRHNYQHPVGSATWSATRTVGRSPATLASNPAVAANSDGTLTLFARTHAGRITHAWQQDGAPNDWQWGGAVGGGKVPGTAVADPAAIRVPGGAVAVFTTTSAGTVQTTRQAGPSDNTTWSAWASLGGSCASSPVPFVDANRALEVLCRTAGGGLAVDVASAGSGGWAGWRAVPGGPGGLSGTPAIVVAGGGQTEVFTAAAGHLAYAWQSPGGTWTWGSSPAGSTRIKNSPAAVAWPGGGVGVVAQQASGQLGYAVQNGGGAAGWGGWTALSAHMLGSPAVWANTSGTPEVAILNKKLNVEVSTFAAGGWSGWTQLGGGY